MNKETLIEDLYIRKYTTIRGRIYSFVKNIHVAEELTQDVFLQVYIGLDSFKGQCKLDTWVYEITNHVCYNYLRKCHTHKRNAYTFSMNKILEDLAIHDFNSPVSRRILGCFEDKKFPDAQHNLFAERELQEVLDQIDKLPDMYKNSLKAAISDDDFLKPRELAKKLNVCPRQARKLLFRARKMLIANITRRKLILTKKIFQCP